MKILCVAVLSLGSLVASGCSNMSCKDACERISECGFQSSRLSCSDSCDALDKECAACVNDDWECDELAEECSVRCFDVVFN